MGKSSLLRSWCGKDSITTTVRSEPIWLTCYTSLLSFSHAELIGRRLRKDGHGQNAGATAVHVGEIEGQGGCDEGDEDGADLEEGTDQGETVKQGTTVAVGLGEWELRREEDMMGGRMLIPNSLAMYRCFV